MAFEPATATVITDPELLATYGRAMRKVGKSVVVVALTSAVHAGHVTLIRAARSLLGSVVVVTFSDLKGELDEQTQAILRRENVDVVYLGALGRGVRVGTTMDHLENAAEVEADVAAMLAVLHATHATEAVIGEKDFEFLVALQRAVTALRVEVKLHSVPTVRTSDGLAISLRNANIAPEHRESAWALSAALTAGAHAAERGAEAIKDSARSVLAAAGLMPTYLDLRDLAFGPAPELGNARLLAAVDLGGVHLTDNVGVPVGIGFKHIDA